jgi:ATP-dependent RNA circularization protein (DNA/RNA ligase family)
MVARKIRGEECEMSDFFRFPHTPHIVWLGEGIPRDDKELSRAEAEQLLEQPVVVEEKVDGANLGFSVGENGELRAQNRGQYLARPYSGQFSRLNTWLATREGTLFDALGESLILFGEWVAAVHSLDYHRPPDYFLVFDVYDRQAQRFWSTARRDALATDLGLHVIHRVGSGRYRLDKLEQMLENTASAYRDGPCEGLYIRQEDENWLTARAKLVRPDFAQSIAEHWRSRPLRWNMVNGRSR